MEKTLSQYYSEVRKEVLEKCTQCGLCIQKCEIVKQTELAKASPKDIQKEVINFLKDGTKSDTVYTRVFSCMECFKCVDELCPKGLNPLLINEIIKWDYRRNNLMEDMYSDPKDQEATQRVLASIQVSKEEYKKISTESDKDKAKYVFFPGCNVYAQPEKILNALDIMDLITEDYAFLPGLDNCCSDVHIYFGSLEKAHDASQELINKLASYHPEYVIFWCPTCQCRFEKTISQITEIPFKVISFPQFLTKHMDKLSFKKRIEKTVTLHEPCKSAFTGVDLTGPRDVLRKIPGVNLIEMPRHGENAACCGSGAGAFFPKSLQAMRDKRLMEAAQTKVDVLIDVCHYCHEVFITEEAKYDYSIVNYVSLVAEALGIEREDKFKKYKQWGNLNRILEDAEKFIEESPYSREKLIEVLKKII